MVPEWIVRLLQEMGVPGGIIFVLLTALVAAIVYIKSMQAKADKVYGYRLQERDTLNKALGDTAKVLADMLKVTEERNDLTEEQARLIEKQAQAFELLKVTVAAQYDNIRDHGTGTAQAVSSMADAIRVLTGMVVENRTIAQAHVNTVGAAIGEMSNSLKGAIQAMSQANITEMRNLLGHVTVIRRRKVVK